MATQDSRRVRFGGVTICLPDGWADITDDLPAGTPFTLAKGDGLGALQFSTALYQGGAFPAASLADLRALLREFAERHSLGTPTGLRERQGPPASVSAAFSANGDHVRVWYVSDGGHFSLVPYVVANDGQRFEPEAAEADAIVDSLQFDPPDWNANRR